MPGEPDHLSFDEDFVNSAAFTEPSARERGRRPGWRKRRMARPRGTTAAPGGAVAAARHRLAGENDRHGARGPPRVRRGRRARLEGPRWPGAVPGDDAGPEGRGSDAERDRPVRELARRVVRRRLPFKIAPPPAIATGGLSARDVEAAYARTRKRLVAAGLDRQTLLGGSPDALARAVGPDERSYFVNNLNNPDLDKRTRSWAVTFAPNTAALSGPVIKVHGTMSAHPSAVSGVRGAGVRFDYLFVYPIQRPGAPATLERLVVRLSGELVFYSRGGTLHSHTSRWEVFSDPARCDVRDGFIHPSYHDSAPERSPRTGSVRDPYDQSRPVPGDEKCYRSSGT